MPIIGNLAEFPLPEVLHFIGARTGRMKLLDVPGANYMELDVSGGVLRGLQSGGDLVPETDAVLAHLSMVLQAGRGMFEFTLIEDTYIRGDLKIPLQSLAMEVAFIADKMSRNTTPVMHPHARFILLQDPQMWLELELRQFFRYAREMIFGQATLHEIADFLGMEETVAAAHLGKLRALGVVDILPENQSAPAKRPTSPAQAEAA